jgi:tripartite-type tricarboxylate transporter receptor subunit TctC
VAVLLALDMVAAADSYPVRPIRIVVASAPGSGSGPDIVTRLIGHKLGETWQQQIIADNRTGAGGNVGADIVAHATPDGYTLLMATASQPISAALYPKIELRPSTRFRAGNTRALEHGLRDAMIMPMKREHSAERVLQSLLKRLTAD